MGCCEAVPNWMKKTAWRLISGFQYGGNWLTCQENVADYGHPKIACSRDLISRAWKGFGMEAEKERGESIETMCSNPACQNWIKAKDTCYYCKDHPKDAGDIMDRGFQGKAIIYCEDCYKHPKGPLEERDNIDYVHRKFVVNSEAGEKRQYCRDLDRDEQRMAEEASEIREADWIRNAPKREAAEAAKTLARINEIIANCQNEGDLMGAMGVSLSCVCGYTAKNFPELETHRENCGFYKKSLEEASPDRRRLMLRIVREEKRAAGLN